ncbi:MAG TPA: class I SAM-dependent methyltransferase [Thauera sp.]|nr:class I SAM-dependent methyltransferase [Thauera sp.]
MTRGDAACVVCGQQGLRPYLPERTWPWREKTYRLVRCSACGSAYSDPLPDDATLADFYRRHFDYRWYADHWAAKLQDARMRVAEYLPKLTGARILDYGGGLGYFSQALREAGRESLTYDPYASGNDPGSGWDAVAALHVLEHANDPAAAITRMKSRLRPGGTLLLAVPNFESTGYRQLGMDWVWAQPPIAHVFHFTARGLEQMLARLGFADVQCLYRERWDANHVADIERHRQSVYCDQVWGLQPLNRFAAYSHAVARWNARRRFAALALAERQDGRSEDKAELEIIARFSEGR